jgi:hypothetical protein
MAERKHKTAVCILTRFYNQHMIDFLNGFENYDVFLVIDDTATIQEVKYGNVTVVQIEDKVCMESNYYKTSSWSNLKDIVAWDRSLYYFNRVNTQYDHIWFMEDDVFIVGEKTLVDIDSQYPESDLLSSFHEINETGNVHHGWNHWVNVIHRIGTPWAHSLISASRLSRRLLDRVDDYLKDRHFMFIEALFNTLALHNGYIVDNPVEMATTITYNTPVDYNNINPSYIYHPIKSIEDQLTLRQRITSSINAFETTK